MIERKTTDEHVKGKFENDISLDEMLLDSSPIK